MSTQLSTLITHVHMLYHAFYGLTMLLFLYRGGGDPACKITAAKPLTS